MAPHGFLNLKGSSRLFSFANPLLNREFLNLSAHPEGLRPGHRMGLLKDGEATFSSMLKAIRCASQFIHLESYIFMSDDMGLAFSDALIERSQKGVSIRIIIDAFGSRKISHECLEKLNTENIEVLIYRPLKWLHRGPHHWKRRDHRKLLIVDGKEGFIGGVNIGLDYTSPEHGGSGWRDTHAHVFGPAVSTMESLFHETWRAEGGTPYKPYANYAHESVMSSSPHWAQIIATGDRIRRSEIRRHYLHAINNSIHSIAITNAYFIPDPAIRRALIKAAKRGVIVQLIVSGKSNHLSAQRAGEASYSKFLKHNIQIFQ